MWLMFGNSSKTQMSWEWNILSSADKKKTYVISSAITWQRKFFLEVTFKYVK